MQQQTEPAASVAAAPEALQPVPGSRDQPNLNAPIGSDRLNIVVNADTWADIKGFSSVTVMVLKSCSMTKRLISLPEYATTIPLASE
jgi:hypothetical protein